MDRPLLLGHRGARVVKTIPENTLTSFDRALADGCDGFEFDLHLTADGEAVVSHDSKVGSHEIAYCTAEELPGLPRLHDVLARYPTAFLDIELKVSGMETAVLDRLRQERPRRFLVSSFLPIVLSTMHASDASVPLGLICNTKAQLRCWRELPVRYVVPHYRLVQEELVKEVHSSHKKVLVWTVNSGERMKQLADWGVDGIISDDTQLLKTTLG